MMNNKKLLIKNILLAIFILTISLCFTNITFAT